MPRTLLMLRPPYESWRLMDNGKPIFMVSEKSAALKAANTIAETRHTFSNRPHGHGSGERREGRAISSYS